MSKLYYKIGEACKELDIQPYVLRYWETEFQALSPNKSKSGQRVYSSEDLQVIRRIKELLYKEGYTIAGAKKKLDSDSARKPAAADDSAQREIMSLGDGGDEDLERPASPAKEVVTVVRKPPKTAMKKKARAAATMSPDADVKRLQEGIRGALREAKAILAILDSQRGSR